MRRPDAIVTVGVLLDQGQVLLGADHRAVRTTTYVDKRTYQVLLGVALATGLRTVQRGIAHTTLPATKANLALASLSAMHPHVRTVLQAPPRIKQLYGEATRF
jgi:hypothetical protein